MGGAEVDGVLGGHAGEEAVDEAGGEAVPAADAVFDFHIFEEAGFVERAFVPEDGGPVVDEAGFDYAEGGADDAEVEVAGDDFFDHLFVGGGVEGCQVLAVDAFDLEAENFLEVLLVADEAIDVGHEVFGDGLGFLAGPEFGAEVEVVGSDGAVGFGFDEGFADGGGGGVGEGGHDAAGVEPAYAALGEEGVEIHIGGLHMHGGGVAAVVEAEAAADAGADFGEVEADAVGLADAVEFRDSDGGDVHADCAGVVEDDLAEGVIDQAGAPGGAKAEACEGVGDVVFAAANPDFQQLRKFEAAVAGGGEADHAFAEGDEVELGGSCGFDGEGHGVSFPRLGMIQSVEDTRWGEGRKAEVSRRGIGGRRIRRRFFAGGR